MNAVNSRPSDEFDRHVSAIYSSRYQVLVRKTDHLFGFLFIFQWILGICFAVFISPRTWSGEYSQTHIHVYAAAFLGGLVAAVPVYLVFTQPGATINRMVVAFSQILFSVLFIHLTGGRIETHFHIFGSLAFLAFYRDWRPVLIGTLVTALDHLLRGYFWPQSVYGVLMATPWRAFEHAAWVLFEDSILWYSIKLALGELHSASKNQANVDVLNQSLERKVEERTHQLRQSQQTIVDQQQTIVSTSKMSALGEMAGGVAHEINNPLAIIKSISGQLQEVVGDDRTDKSLIREMAQQIEATTDRIAKIVQGLRSFSRDGSKDPFRKVDVTTLFEETLSFCNERFKSHGILIRIDPFDETLSFDGRATEISQVLLNLLNNAHDAISSLKERWVRISAVDKSDWLEIQVTDSGQGVPSDFQTKIFQPFFTTKEIGKGTGMGLSISRGIVQGHGGELRLDSTCSNTRFVIHLPKRQKLRMAG